MDFGALPPEFNSARMYSGPGAGSLLAAAAAWDGLAANLRSSGAAYGSVVSGLTDGPWLGPSSAAMAAAAAPYVGWINATAEQAELAATQARAAAGAYETAFAMTVPPPVIAANRAQLAALTATNFFGQNNAAIAATEAHYGEMWAQDATAMYGYAANGAATTAQMTGFTAAPQTTNQAGIAAQAAATTQVAGASTGTGVQSTLSQLLSSIQSTLQSLASPSSSTSSTSGLSGILSQLLGGSSSGASTSAAVLPGLGGPTSSGSSLTSMLQNVATEYAVVPAWFAMMMTTNALGPLLATPQIGFQMAAQSAMQSAAAAGAAPVAGLPGALGPGFAGGLGGFAGLGGAAGLGEAASVGALSVPPSWGWAATAPAAMLGAVPLEMPAAGALPLAAADVGGGLGFPFMFGGLPRAAAMGAGIGVGAAAVKYGSRLTVMARPPAAGYPAEPAAAPMPKYPVPAGFPTNGHAPPGYQPAVVYLPTNGHKPATT